MQGDFCYVKLTIRVFDSVHTMRLLISHTLSSTARNMKDIKLMQYTNSNHTEFILR